jgi:PTH1 family peptidyl-tRNA hydrolase
MKLIVGLGNPGSRYFETRHNVGFDLLNAFADRHFFLLAPQTYMNASGRSVRQCVDFYRVDPEDILVLLDDLNLDLGRLRLRGKGSAGGQKGLADIIRQLGTDEIPRLRFGIGRPPGRMDVSSFVLQKFTDDERREVDVSLQDALAGLDLWVSQGLEAAMNEVNRPAQ